MSVRFVESCLSVCLSVYEERRHPVSVIIQYCYLLYHARVRSRHRPGHDASTQRHSMRVIHAHASTHVLHSRFVSFRHSRPCIVQVPSHCTPRGTKVSCCFAPTGQSSVFSSPHCLSSSSSLSSDVTSTNSYDLSFLASSRCVR